VTHFRISDAARLLGVSDDTVRRWVNGGMLPAGRDRSGRKIVDGAALAAFARDHAGHAEGQEGRASARNRFPGIVTDVVKDGLMAQVEMQAGPFRVVSLMTREAADELGLEPGSLASAVIKATTVIIEAREDRS
jgi:molybdopterin-binding protein